MERVFFSSTSVSDLCRNYSLGLIATCEKFSLVQIVYTLSLKRYTWYLASGPILLQWILIGQPQARLGLGFVQWRKHWGQGKINMYHLLSSITTMICSLWIHIFFSLWFALRSVLLKKCYWKITSTANSFTTKLASFYSWRTPYIAKSEKYNTFFCLHLLWSSTVFLLTRAIYFKCCPISQWPTWCVNCWLLKICRYLLTHQQGSRGRAICDLFW
jgi:hypothetical protein